MTAKSTTTNGAGPRLLKVLRLQKTVISTSSSDVQEDDGTSEDDVEMTVEGEPHL